MWMDNNLLAEVLFVGSGGGANIGLSETSCAFFELLYNESGAVHRYYGEGCCTSKSRSLLPHCGDTVGESCTQARSRLAVGIYVLPSPARSRVVYPNHFDAPAQNWNAWRETHAVEHLTTGGLCKPDCAQELQSISNQVVASTKPHTLDANGNPGWQWNLAPWRYESQPSRVTGEMDNATRV
ncbi:hypothetical protein PCASD_01287 [Puccinia coronata f. sp. avenae]|uniref:Uncharacterized protein n=1 Tax=Puccinia coronata f. sp. avenae TaxID=200324 RepID=A0A2N5VJ08_9BASI|nr:hypothetical protein PCASD_01287 [Puccinia coronata f. sp. avenae]